MDNIQTLPYYLHPETQQNIRKVLLKVFEILEERGYDPVNQITGYLISGDPAYITNYKGARNMIARVDRDEILEELVRNYGKNRTV